jgi:hypothetical protein
MESAEEPAIGAGLKVSSQIEENRKCRTETGQARFCEISLGLQPVATEWRVR